MDGPLEQVIEANTLLSGLGFESGGLAAAHGVGMSFTAIQNVHDKHLHGEMVAFGVLVQLALEDRLSEARRVAAFFNQVGLPITTEDLSVAADDKDSLAIIVDGTLQFPFLTNMPFAVGAESVRLAIASANQIGSEIAG